jgi:hypothetical protein
MISRRAQPNRSCLSKKLSGQHSCAPNGFFVETQSEISFIHGHIGILISRAARKLVDINGF